MADVDPAAIARLLKPRSVAIVGASSDPRSIGGNVLANLKRAGFAGDLHLVSRTKAEIDGHPCVQSIDDLPLGLDAIVLIVPQEAVLDAIAACARRRVNGAVVFASGFAEAGPDGRALQERLAALARESGVVVNGPNNLGFINYVDGIPLTFGEYRPMRGGRHDGRRRHRPERGDRQRDPRLAHRLRPQGDVPHQHGQRGHARRRGFPRRGAGGADNRRGRAVRRADPQPAEAATARGTARGSSSKRIVLMQPGRTERAQAAAQSHTGAFAGDLAVARTMLANAGVAVVDGLDALVDVALLLAMRPVPVAGRTAFMTNSGAMRGLAFDFAHEAGLELAEWSPATVAGLREIFPPFVAIDNPLDMGTVAFAQA